MSMSSCPSTALWPQLKACRAACHPRCAVYLPTNQQDAHCSAVLALCPISFACRATAVCLPHQVSLTCLNNNHALCCAASALCQLRIHLQGYCYVNYSTPNAAAAAVNELNGIEFPVGSGFRLKVMYAEIMTGAGGAGSSSGSNAAAAAAAMMRSSSSRSSLRTPSAGQLGSLTRGGSGGLAQQHSSSSGTLVPQGSMGGLGSIGSQLGAPGSGAGSASGPNSTGGGISMGGGIPPSGAVPGSAAAAGLVGAGSGGTPVPVGMGSRGPSPAATPMGGPHQHHQHQHQQQGITCSDVGHVADSLSSMSLPCMTGPNAGLGSMGSLASDPGSEAAAAAAAAAHHFDHLQASAAAAHVGGGVGGSSGVLTWGVRGFCDERW
jgi:hypothetical protein